MKLRLLLFSRHFFGRRLVLIQDGSSAARTQKQNNNPPRNDAYRRGETGWTIFLLTARGRGGSSLHRPLPRDDAERAAPLTHCTMRRWVWGQVAHHEVNVTENHICIYIIYTVHVIFLRLTLRWDRLRIGSDNQAGEGRTGAARKRREKKKKRYSVSRECAEGGGAPGTHSHTRAAVYLEEKGRGGTGFPLFSFSRSFSQTRSKARGPVSPSCVNILNKMGGVITVYMDYVGGETGRSWKRRSRWCKLREET